MNRWAIDLKAGENLIQVADMTCDFEGRTIQEYTIENTSGNVVLHIGANLYLLETDLI
jgi:hypothetical protein